MLYFHNGFLWVVKNGKLKCCTGNNGKYNSWKLSYCILHWLRINFRSKPSVFSGIVSCYNGQLSFFLEMDKSSHLCSNDWTFTQCGNLTVITMLLPCVLISISLFWAIILWQSMTVKLALFFVCLCHLTEPLIADSWVNLHHCWASSKPFPESSEPWYLK